MDILLPLLTAPLLVGVAFGYVRGWNRLHIIQPGLATRLRLFAFTLSMLLLAAALLWPLHGLSRNFLLARTLQKIAIVMLAAPFFWLSCGFHFIAWGMPTGLRKITARLWFRNGNSSIVLKNVFNLVVVWFLFLASVLSWHDSNFVDLIMPNPWIRNLIPLWMVVVGLLFWWQIVGTGPRRYTTRSSVARIGALLAIEVINVAMGMFIAFHQEPLYAYYSNLRSANPIYYLNAISAHLDQSASGGINWVFGSAVYFGSVILVVNGLWRSVSNSEQPQPPLNWDADEKFIMPGLEGRVRSKPPIAK